MQGQRYVAQQVLHKLMGLAAISYGDSATPSGAPWKKERSGGTPDSPSHSGTTCKRSSATRNALEPGRASSAGSTEYSTGAHREHAVHAPLVTTPLGGAPTSGH